MDRYFRAELFRDKFDLRTYRNLLDPKIRKPFRSKRYENLSDENPKDTKTKTFWIQRYENLLERMKYEV